MIETTLRLTSPSLPGDKYVLRKQTGEKVSASFSYASSNSTLHIFSETAGYFKLTVFYSRMGTTRTYNVWIGEELNDGGLDYYGVGGSQSDGPLSPVARAEVEQIVAEAAPAGGGGGWVASVPLTPQVDMPLFSMKFRLANPGGVSFLEFSGQIPAGSAGEEYEFTLDLDSLTSPELEALDDLGASVSILSGLDMSSSEFKPAVLSYFLDGIALTTPLEHSRLNLSGATPVLPRIQQQGGGGIV